MQIMNVYIKVILHDNTTKVNNFPIYSNDILKTLHNLINWDIVKEIDRIEIRKLTK